MAPGDEPGRSGADATVRVDPRRVGPVTMAYSPRSNGSADPGEIVWSWVPFDENDGRGKDRPLLVVAGEASGSVLAVPLTSQAHPGRPEFLAIGTGGWDAQGRPSFVDVGRVFRVQQQGMRREAAALDVGVYSTVRSALQARYGWH